MGEIKSTLEIIMEKTKGLTMSDEEKEAFREQEASGKIKGVVRKYLDGVIDLGRLKIEVIALEKEAPETVKRVLLEEAMSKIEVEGDNRPIFELLEQVLDLDTSPMRKALEEARQGLEMKRSALEKAMLESLEEKGISGSAVLPNIEGNKDWMRQVEKIRDELRTELETLRESSG